MQCSPPPPPLAHGRQHGGQRPRDREPGSAPQSLTHPDPGGLAGEERAGERGDPVWDSGLSPFRRQAARIRSCHRSTLAASHLACSPSGRAINSCTDEDGAVASCGQLQAGTMPGARTASAADFRGATMPAP